MSSSLLDYILRIRLPITLFVIVSAFAITYYASRPERDGIGYSPDQPITFSHKLHAGDMKIDCQYCHIGVEKSRHATVPSVNVCMNCHMIARKDRPQIMKLTEYYNQGKALPWKRIHRVADFAYFNHSVHVNRGIDCAVCHGEVSKMEKILQVNSFTMGTCLNCHRNPHENIPNITRINNGPTNCFACHR